MGDMLPTSCHWAQVRPGSCELRLRELPIEGKWKIPEALEPKDLGLVPFPANSLDTLGLQASQQQDKETNTASRG